MFNSRMPAWQRYAFLFILFFSVKLFAVNGIDGVRVWPAPDSTRVVFDLKQQPDFSYFSLQNPNRLVIDLKNNKHISSLKNLAKNDKRILKIRTSTPKSKNDTRLVVELADKYKISVFALAPAGQYGNRLVVDIHDKKINVTKQITKQPPNKLRDIIIAIDAGHGGEDPGSIGPKGTYEKRITLAIAKKLEALINKEKGMKAVMIRTGDYFVDINRRTQIARAKQVDFLVSIHADAFTSPQPHGASIWVVSKRRAQTELARWLDNRQRNSALLGGGGEVIRTTKDDNLALTLADMNREYSLETSIGVSRNILSRLRKITRLHKKETQFKSLGVLKSSDIPSILVETGFISNHQEERNLRSTKHQAKLAKAIYIGIKNYFMEHPISGSYFASISQSKHQVSRGESLSVIAARYNISVNALKSVNNLKSNVVRIGQTLKIPRAD